MQDLTGTLFCRRTISHQQEQERRTAEYKVAYWGWFGSWLWRLNSHWHFVSKDFRRRLSARETQHFQKLKRKFDLNSESSAKQLEVLVFSQTSNKGPWKHHHELLPPDHHGWWISWISWISFEIMVFTDIMEHGAVYLILVQPQSTPWTLLPNPYAKG